MYRPLVFREIEILVERSLIGLIQTRNLQILDKSAILFVKTILWITWYHPNCKLIPEIWTSTGNLNLAQLACYWRGLWYGVVLLRHRFVRPSSVRQIHYLWLWVYVWVDLVNTPRWFLNCQKKKKIIFILHVPKFLIFVKMEPYGTENFRTLLYTVLKLWQPNFQHRLLIAVPIKCFFWNFETLGFGESY